MQPAPSSPQPIPDDLTCAGCGYALRGLDDAASCPECGHPVQASRLAAAAMTKRDLTMILCRLLGLWFLLTPISSIPYAIWFLGGVIFDLPVGMAATQLTTQIFSQAAYYGLVFVASIFLWFGAPWIARHAVPQDGRIGPTVGLTARSLTRVGVFLLGLWFTVVGVQQSVDGFLFGRRLTSDYFLAGYTAQGMQGLLKIAIGAAFMIDWARWVALGRKLRIAK